MSTLYLDRKNLEVRADGATLTLYENGERQGQVPLALLERVVIRGAATLTTGVLSALAEAGVGLAVLNGRKTQRTAILPGRAHSDVTRRIAQYRWYLDEPRRAQFARGLVTAKLKAQRRLLAEGVAQRPDQRKRLLDGLNALDNLLTRLKSPEQLTLATLRGLEGAAAAAYFQALTALFPPSLNFTGRNRRPPRDPVNACLSLGYTLAHFEAVLACQAVGLEPLLGFYHEPAFGRDSLAADFVEPLRPRVDGWVWGMFRERSLRAEHFASDKGACLLGKAGRKLFYESWEALARTLRRWLRRRTSALARELSRSSPVINPLEEDPWTEI